jgi:hypothetical protein
MGLPFRALKAKVVQVMRTGACEVVTANSIAIAIHPPEACRSELDDQFRFTGLLEGDSPVLVENLTRGWSAEMRIRDHDVHDLRLPVKHGASRVPSVQRLHQD